MSISVGFDQQRLVFICRCPTNQRHIPERAKFFWNPINKWWETKKASVAVRLREYFDGSAKVQIGNTQVNISPWPDGHLLVPSGKTLRPYQAKGVWFSLNRNHSYLAFEQGLGKTPTGIVISNMVMSRFFGPTLIICPPFLVENWKREISEWSIFGKPPSELLGKGLKGDPDHEIIILPDSFLDRPAVWEYIEWKDFGLLEVDEAHRFKTHDAKRTEGLFRITKRIPKVVLLSGTPMPNRPMELYPVLSNLASNTIDFMDRHQYGVKFCNGHEVNIPVRGEFKTKWDYSGASNLSQLSKQIQNKFMLRYTKLEMLPELEPKEERAVILSDKTRKEIRKMEAAIIKKFGDSAKKIVAKQNLGDIARYRQEIGMMKVKPALEYIKDILDNSKETILICAWHWEVIKELYMGLAKYGRGMITGKHSKKMRDATIDDIQKGKIRVLVAQVTTMVGYNITKATRCIFVEASWAPADNDQAADRLHRIGQKNSVTVDYLVLANSLDERIVTSFLTKQKNISRVIG